MMKAIMRKAAMDRSQMVVFLLLDIFLAGVEAGGWTGEYMASRFLSFNFDPTGYQNEIVMILD
jgi:hypothetical protein